MTIDHSFRKSLADASTKAVGDYFRSRRMALFWDMIDRVANSQPGTTVKILDMGGTAGYWSRVGLERLRSTPIELTLLNLPETEPNELPDGFRWHSGDACSVPEFNNGAFDIVHSNSVIEHVGSWHRMKQFANEVRRLGRTYLVQTPSYWTPVEPHFLIPGFQFIPEPVKRFLLTNIGAGHHAKADDVDQAQTLVDSAQLLTKNQMRFLFPNASIVTERVLLWPKSYTAVKGLDSEEAC